jgi:hypothetical protein
MPFRELLTQFVRSSFDLEIPARLIPNRVTETPQLTSEFVIIGILGKLPCAEQFVVLERFPAILDRVECRIKNNAVRVQMRVERAGVSCVNSAAAKLPVDLSFCAPPVRTRLAANASNCRNADFTALA